MNPHIITAEIKTQFESVAKFARIHGLHRQNVSDVIHGRRVSAKIRKAISDGLNIPVEVLFSK